MQLHTQKGNANAVAEVAATFAAARHLRKQDPVSGQFKLPTFPSYNKQVNFAPKPNPISPEMTSA